MGMSRNQAIELLKQIAAMYANTPLNNELARNKYLNELEKLDYDTTVKAIDTCLTTMKHCPTIADIREQYSRHYRDLQRVDVQRNSNICNICKGRGVIQIMQQGYIFATYCTCELGQDYIYNGQNVSDHKSQYYSRPITDYGNIRELLQKRAWNDVIILSEAEE